MDARQAYQQRLVETATPIGLIVLLFERGVLALERAIAALERGDIETRTSELNRGLAVVATLKRALNFEQGGAVARQFDGFYRHAEHRMVEAAWRQDAAPLRELLGQFVQIRDAWRQAECKPAAPQDDCNQAANTAGEVRTAWRA